MERSSQTPSESPEAAPMSTKISSREKSEREKRTYRACLHCRQRKSRCDLYSSGEPGRPPCERCIREQHECVLGGSRRGGRRVKRSSSDAAAALPDNSELQPANINNLLRPHISCPPRAQDDGPPSRDEQRMSRMLPPLPQEHPVHPNTWLGSKMTIDESVVSTDLQNPADALEFLAHVAERDSGVNQLPPMHSSVYSQATLHGQSAVDSMHGVPRFEHSAPAIDFPPLVKGLLSLEMIHALLMRYEQKYHPFFPLANPLIFDMSNLQSIAAKEPHQLAAILTVASKDEKDWWHVHEACSAHMQQLVGELVYGGGGTVEAVEAMLILAEWVPRRPHLLTPAVGRGEEDEAAWMYVGTAIRLGYLLGIDRSGFRVESEAQSAELNRKRLAWAACYMSDRQISVRIGKAFWSRGPGPMTALRAQDFPSLQSRPNQHDDFAAIFEANLELTQLFSNAHDVLYATKSRSNQLNFGGEYVKYIDDFRVALRSWNTAWGGLSCSPPLKASLILSYEYLRLYVNAFAYQATLNRMVAQVQSNSQVRQRSTPTFPFADIAAAPDARFIYDSIDAAKSLLSTFNTLVDPVETFRFMPLRYYLYVIYSACFLYKARSTGVMGGETRGSTKSLVTDTIDKLNRASACPNDVGDRYSRLIRLLWRKPPSRMSVAAEGPGTTRPATLQTQGSIPAPSNIEPEQMKYDFTHNAPSINTFSWLDLPAVVDYATQNNSISDSISGSMDGFDVSSADGFGGFEQDFMMTSQGTWDGITPSDIVF